MYNTKTSREVLEKVAEKLIANGMNAIVVSNSVEAKEKVLSMIDKDVEVMNMTSITLDTIGVPQALKDGGYNVIRDIFAKPETETKRKRELGAAPDVSVTSVSAVTENGELLIASNTGSQLPAAAYGSAKAIFVIGAQKVVPDIQEGIKRIYEYVLPLESERANKAYNITAGSSVNKLLIVNKEVQKGRVEIILVDESLGF